MRHRVVHDLECVHDDLILVRAYSTALRSLGGSYGMVQASACLAYIGPLSGLTTKEISCCSTLPILYHLWIQFDRM